MSLQTPMPPDNAGLLEQRPEWPNGKRVSPDNERKQVALRLKNGEFANARWALAERDSLERLMRRQPREFEVLLNLCRGEAPPTGSEVAWNSSVEVLKQRRDVLDDGTVRPLTRNVLLSAYRLTPDGPVMTQPFALTNQQEKQLADLVDRQADDAMKRFVRDVLADNDKGHSR